MSIVWSTPLNHTDKIVLLALADNANDEGSCYPSIATVAAKCGLDARSVFRVMGRLEEAGHLSRHDRPGRSSTYTVHPCQPVTPDLKSPLTESHTTPDTESGPPLTHSEGTPDTQSPITIIEPSIEPSVNHRKAKQRLRVVSDPPEFSDLQAIYPRRSGTQDWPKALKAVNARISEGHTWDEILGGARRYALHIRAIGNEGTQYVKQAVSFCGTSKFFLEAWLAPVEKESTMDEILRLNSRSASPQHDDTVIEHEPDYLRIAR